MKHNIEFEIGVTYIAFMTGLSWAKVGQLSGPSEPYPWYLPLTVLAFCLVPFVLGFLSGRNSR